MISPAPPLPGLAPPFATRPARPRHRPVSDAQPPTVDTPTPGIHARYMYHFLQQILPEAGTPGITNYEQYPGHGPHSHTGTTEGTSYHCTYQGIPYQHHEASPNTRSEIPTGTVICLGSIGFLHGYCRMLMMCRVYNTSTCTAVPVVARTRDRV